MADLTHFDDNGNAHMVDISDKQNSFRTAKAACYIQMSLEALRLALMESKKGRCFKRSPNCWNTKTRELLSLYPYAILLA